jgi:carbonic anhydrase/acetyltransferase-like protein (isoleucine patch superfamily)
MALYEIDGRAPTLPADGDYYVAEDAAVIGSVILGAGATVWFGCVVRGDNERIEIGAGSNVQDNSTLHADPGIPLTIGRNVTIGHTVILHGCTVEDNVLIGMGAIVMNRARIRTGSIVGAGAVITEGKDYPAGSLILGAPARVMRPLKDDEIAGLARPAAGYAAKGKLYRSGLKRIG